MSNKTIFKKTIIFSIVLLLLVCNSIKVLALSDSNQIENRLKTNEYINKFDSTGLSIVASGIDDNIEWTLYDNGALLIDGSGDMQDYDYNDIHLPNTAPWSSYTDEVLYLVIEDSITSIGSFAFSAFSNLVSVNISNSIISIGKYAFSDCSNLKSVTIPNSVTTIGIHAFSGCSKLTTITIPDSVTLIGDGVLNCCSNLISINVDINNPNYVSINNVLFEKSNNTLTKLVTYPAGKDNSTYSIPSPVTSIASSAFSGCTSLTSITIPKSVTSVGINAFLGCTNLIAIDVNSSNPNYMSINGVLFEKEDNVPTEIIQYPFGKTDTSYEIPNTVTSLSNSAFIDCTNLKSITIPDSVVSTDGGSFAFCTGLTSLTMPISFDFVHAFYDVTNLEAVTLTAGTGVGIDYTNETYQNTPWYQSRNSLTNIIIANGVTSIGANTFKDCSSLTSINIPDSVTSIGNSAFYNCSGLTSLTIPNSVTSIGSYTFNGCSGLTSITIPDSVTSIGNYAFRNCSSSLVAHIGSSEYVKNYCTSNGVNYVRDLYTITFDSNGGTPIDPITQIYETDILTPINPTKEGYKFVGWNPTLPSTMPNRDLTVTAMWEEIVEFGTINNINWFLLNDGTLLINGTGAIPNYGYPVAPWYDYRNSITSIVISDTITSIGDQSFISCPNLTSITIGDSVTSIGEGAFYGCSSLETVFIPSSVTTIKEGAFYECTHLRYMVISNSVTSIGEEAFEECPNLTIYIYNNDYVKNHCIENGITYIGVDSPFTLTGISITPSTKTEYELHEELDLTGFSIQEIYTSGSYSITNPRVINDGYTITGYNPNRGGTQTIIVSYKGVSSSFDVNVSRGSIEHSGVDDNINWTLYEDGTLVIDGSGDMPDYNYDSEAPWCSYRNNIVNAIIGNQITSIGDYAFYACYSLTSINIPNSITSIGNSAFVGSYIDSIAIPNSVTSIGDYAFMSCNSTSITIPSSVTSIGNSAFRFSYIKSINLDPNNPNYVSIDGVLFEKTNNVPTKIILYPFGKKETSYVIPNSVTSIGDSAFYSSSLTSITIPDLVTSIGDGAYCASSLKSITIPNSVTTIEYLTFAYCYDLTSITIPDSVTSIGYLAFSDCRNLTSLTIPISTIIEPNSFSGYENLQDVNNLESVTLTAGTGVGVDYTNETYKYTPWYLSRSNLTNVVLEDGITYIGDYTFKDQSNLTQIIIPSTVSSIGEHVFDNCNEDLVLASYENEYLQQYCLDNGYTYLELTKISDKTMNGTLKSNGTVSLNLKVDIDDTVDLEKGAYALVNGTKVLLADKLDSDTGKVIISTPGVPAKNLGDNITIRYYDGNDNPISKEINLSVKEYIETLLSGYLNKKTKTFYKSLLNYSAYAQEYFDYDTDNLVNDSLDDIDKDVSSVSHDDLNSYAAIKGGYTEGISAYGQTLVLNNEIDYRIYFLLDGSHSIDEYTFKDNNATLNKFKYSDTLYYVIVPKMAAPDLDKSHTVTVTLNNEGNLSVTSSVLTYAELILKKDNTSEQAIKLENLMKAMYKYSLAAKAVIGG